MLIWPSVFQSSYSKLYNHIFEALERDAHFMHCTSRVSRSNPTYSNLLSSSSKKNQALSVYWRGLPQEMEINKNNFRILSSIHSVVAEEFQGDHRPSGFRARLTIRLWSGFQYYVTITFETDQTDVLVGGGWRAFMEGATVYYSSVHEQTQDACYRQSSEISSHSEIIVKVLLWQIIWTWKAWTWMTTWFL